MPDEKPKPCRWCKSPVVETVCHANWPTWWVACLSCGANGPRADTQDEAIAAWNRRAPAMTDKPESLTAEEIAICREHVDEVIALTSKPNAKTIMFTRDALAEVIAMATRKALLSDKATIDALREENKRLLADSGSIWKEKFRELAAADTAERDALRAAGNNLRSFAKLFTNDYPSALAIDEWDTALKEKPHGE